MKNRSVLISILIVLFVLLCAVLATFFAFHFRHKERGEKESVGPHHDRPMLQMDGEFYINPYMPLSYLPHGFTLSGELTKEQAHNTGLEGVKYYTNTSTPNYFYTYQLWATPVSIDTLDSENRTWQYMRWIRCDAEEDRYSTLTLENVKIIAQRKNEVTWMDFDPYTYEEIGSGLYIRHYPIDERYDFLIGSASTKDEPMYFYLRDIRLDSQIDIRTADVEDFLSGQKVVMPTAELISEDSLSSVVAVLRNAGLSNVDVFESWVKNFREDAENDLGSATFSDADCRMTVMLLAGDSIIFDNLEKNYSGSYLMFDVDAIESKEDYQILRDKLDLFTTLFGEMRIVNGSYNNAFPDNWTQHGIRINNEACSIISIVFETYEGREVFVGHTGILIDCRNDAERESNYLFVEKLAFGEPYQMIKLNKPEELIELFSMRPDYSATEGGRSPLVFINDKYLGELEK